MHCCTTYRPGTGELGIRIGLHSGPVTAGVLRGEKGRFQLFGDTVNTAARMETTGAPNRIHLSQEIVDLLLDAGKSHWVSRREDKVVAKGKGVLNTFWLETMCSDLYESKTSQSETDSSSGSRTMECSPDSPRSVDKQNGLVDWNVTIMKGVLSQVVAARQARAVKRDPPDHIERLEQESLHEPSLEEVREVVSLPNRGTDTASRKVGLAELPDEVKQQLRAYINVLSTMYSDSNPFHNFLVSNSCIVCACAIILNTHLPSDRLILACNTCDNVCSQVIESHRRTGSQAGQFFPFRWER